MSTERGGLIKARAESFARHLQSRLRSLSTEDSGWASSSSDEVYYDIDSSQASPEEEVAEPIFIADQNREFLLERCDSAGSQYFDAMEDLASPVSPGPTSRKIPILHLKTDTILNGHTNLLDVDIGCSRVREMSSIGLEPEVLKDESENICDNNGVLENIFDTGRGSEEIDLELETQPELEAMNICDSTITEVDVRLSEDEVASENIEGDSEISTDSFCVFCGIEQIKSSLSNNCTENTTNDGKSYEFRDSKMETKLERPFLEDPDSSEDNKVGNYSPEREENVSLIDLLEVIKQEMASEQNQTTVESKEKENSNTPQTACPSIEIRESSPTTIESKSKKKEEEYDIETKRKNFRRCSSLRSGKTPPSTPGRKKIVRFADVLGLDLADVKTFMDEVPTVPKSAYEDLHGIDLTTPVVELVSTKKDLRPPVVVPQQDKVLMPLFQQPSGQPNFLDLVRENYVCLENAVVTDTMLFAITGLVRVKNIDFHKSVYIRYSINNWRSYSDLQARYVPNSCDGFSDKFSFVLYAHTLSVGDRLEFAVRFHAAGKQFWDSNRGHNYIFECTSRGPPRTYIDPGAEILTCQMETWASFY